MTIYAKNLQAKPEEGLESELTIRIIGAESREQFCLILRRALNCDPGFAQEWKELSDCLDHGKVLQDYSKYNTKINSGHNPELGTPEYVREVAGYVERYGIDEWREQLMNRRPMKEWLRDMQLKYGR